MQHKTPLALFTLLLLWLPGAHAQGEWLLFTDVTATARDLPADMTPVMATRELEPMLTLFGNLDQERYQVLFEGMAKPDTMAIERLQLGWNMDQNNTLWIGRFHNPFDYWSDRFHHGLYFQTSQSRPGVVAFEEDGGVMPIHLSGLLLSGIRLTPDMAGIRYDLALGVGPQVQGDSDGSRLESPSPLAPLERNGRHGQALSLRLTYLPDILDENELGLFISRTRMPTENVNNIYGDVIQLAGGLFGHWQKAHFKLLGAAIVIRHQLNMAMPGTVRQTMNHLLSNQYLQGEYGFRPRWQVYARLETTQGIKDDPYIQSFAMFVEDRALLGLRHDYRRQQAIRLELARARHQHNAAPFNSLALQWSALWP